MSDLRIPSELYQSMLEELKLMYQDRGDMLREDMIEAVLKAVKDEGYAIVPVEPTPQWQPIETAPKAGKLILVPGGLAYWGSTIGSGEGWISAIDRRLIQWEVTHWMPIPKRPKETDE